MSSRELKIRTACAQRGIAIHQQGKAWRFTGKGIDLLVADFDCVELENLIPVRNPHNLKLKIASRK